MTNDIWKTDVCEQECLLRTGPTRYRSCEKNVRLESALVRLARNQFTWGEMGRLRIVEW
jgi:hypothetical protein